MASRLIFDPLVVLRTAPLVSATCTLLYARDQHFFLSGLNQPDTRKHSAPLLSGYFRYTFRHGVVLVVAAVGFTFGTSVANLYTHSASLHTSRSHWWYAAGAGFSLGHLLFVPAIAPSVKGLMDTPEGEDVRGFLDRWLSINALRTLTVDLAAWGALVVAVTRALVAA